METIFELWLEFEQWVPKEDDDLEDDCFNMLVILPNGKRYALNVWTFRFLERMRHEDREGGGCLGGKYLVPPDLLVERLDRHHIEEVIADLVQSEGLNREWETEEDNTLS